MMPTEVEGVGWALIELAFGTVLRSLILAALCGCGVWLLRARTAELRFRLWKWTLFALLTLPLLMGVTPPLQKASRGLSQVESAILPSGQQAIVALGYRPHNSQTVPIHEASNSAVLVLVIPGFYLLVAAALVARLGYSLSRLGRMAERSEFIPDPHLRELAGQIWLESGAHLKPRLAASDMVRAPVTFELGDIWILVPRSWPKWEEAKLRAVLTHEMAHVRRRDSANLLVASLATCLFWFHPLSWFLQRRLSALAEEACDEAAVKSATTPEQYATFLIEFARDVGRQHGRLAMEATAVVRSSQIKRRIEHLFADARYKQRGRKVLTALALALFAPAVYLVAAARFDALKEPKTSYTGKIPWGRWEQITSLGPEGVASLQAAVRANPEDLDSRMELLVYFGYSGQDLPFTDQLLWFIKHHPDIPSIEMAQGMYRRWESLNEGSREQIRAAWEQAIAEHTGSPRVLLNGASFLERADPEHGLEILQRAQAMDAAPGAEYERKIAAIYAAAELAGLGLGGKLNNIEMSRETGERLRAQLKASGDPALLSATGRILVELSSPRDNGEQNRHGLELIEQAIQLDPGNAKWTEALQSAQAEPQRKLNYQRLMTPQSPQPRTIRISSSVAEANLVSKIDPVYPPLAVAARIQGLVEFTVTVGPDGKIQNIQLVRGHPLLVNAAKDAVLKWVYHPALQDGKAVPFETEVIVPFRQAE